MEQSAIHPSVFTDIVSYRFKSRIDDLYLAIEKSIARSESMAINEPESLLTDKEADEFFRAQLRQLIEVNKEVMYQLTGILYA